MSVVGKRRSLVGKGENKNGPTILWGCHLYEERPIKRVLTLILRGLRSIVHGPAAGFKLP